MRILAALAIYITALMATAFIAFFAVIFLAGPHAGLLPSWLEAAVLALAWLAVLVLPLLIARKAWRRLGKSSPSPF